MIEFLKLWYIALIYLVDDAGSYRRAENSYSPAYPGCHINTANIFNFIRAIYDWILWNFETEAWNSVRLCNFSNALSFIVCIKFIAIYKVFKIYRFSFFLKKAYFFIHTAHIFNFISAIYDWIFVMIWSIALINE